MNITAAEAVSRLKVNRATLYAYVSRGLIRAEADPRDSRKRLYLAEDVDRLAVRKARGRAPTKVAAATLDWGLPVLDSAITLIDGVRLFYRGHDAVHLATTTGLEDCARLLWDCGATDPFEPAMPPAPSRWQALTRDLRDAGTVERVQVLLPLMAESGLASWRREPSRLWPAAARLMRHVAAAATASAPSVAPIHRHLAEAWGQPQAAEAIRTALVLCADHELNASTFTVRVVASTGAALGNCVLAGLAALSGPRHGGQTAQVEVLFDEFEQLGDATKAVEARLARGDRLPGFSHPLYPDGDPRARAILALLPPERSRDGLFTAAERIGGWLPNLDVATVALRRAMSLPRGAAMTIFAVGRTAGWIAHAFEQAADGKLIRPRARYVGPAPATG